MRSIGQIKRGSVEAVGTGFLLRGGDLIPALGDEMVVVTNAHVISDPPEETALAPDEANITFEAAASPVTCTFARVLWQSGSDELDCCILRLTEKPAGLAPLRITARIAPIPLRQEAARPVVYIIGYPQGRPLTVSLQNNDLLDHEAPQAGTPPRESIRRVQYMAPTEPGSSGSPVFESADWRVIALHHAGDYAMPKLNGKPGTWPANEGIWIQSIVEAATRQGIRP
jgi:V8-like Glu-specific endopeptidase